MEGAHLLLVEDEPITAVLHARQLEKYGYRVSLADSGESAVSLGLSMNDLDLILMDIDLGTGMDGTQAAGKILSERDVPILFLSSHTEAAVVDRTKEITSYGYVAKSSGSAVLEASVRMAIKLSRARKELRLAQEHQKAILNALPDLLFEVDQMGVVLDFYSGTQELLYVPPENFLGKNFAQFLPPETSEILFRGISEVDGPDPGKHLLYSLVISGQIHWFEASIAKKSGPSGEPRFLMLCRDVSSRIQAEEELSAQQGQFKNLLEQLPQIIYRYRINSGALYWSPRVESILGFTKDDLMNNPKLWHDSIHPEDIQEVDRILGLLKPGSTFKMEYRIYDTLGRLHWLEDQCLSVVDFGGDMEVTGSALDITLQKQMVNDLQERSKEQSITTMAGGLAHDFNNLLGGIYSSLEVALHQPPGKGHDEFLQKAMESLEKSRSLTKQLMFLTADSVTAPGTCNLREFIRETVETALSGTSVKPRMEMDKALWACLLDPASLASVMDALVLWFVQETKKSGGIFIKATNETVGEREIPSLVQGPYVKIQLSNPEVLLEAERLRGIIEPHAGSNQGLAAANLLLNRHGGSLEASSTPGIGFCFTLHLPAAELDDDKSCDDGFQGVFQGKGLVLILEDDPGIRDSLAMILSTFGFTVVSFSDGEELIQSFEDKLTEGINPAGFFLDMTIPGGKGGKEVIQDLRRIFPEVPMVAMSGHLNHEVMINPRFYGFTTALEKPFQLADISKLLIQNFPEN